MPILVKNPHRLPCKFQKAHRGIKIVKIDKARIFGKNVLFSKTLYFLYNL